MFSSLFIGLVIIPRPQALYRYSARRFADGCLMVSFANSLRCYCWAAPVLGWRWVILGDVGVATMRLVPARTVPESAVGDFGASRVGDRRAAGQFFGGIIGWRNVFNAAAVMGVLCVTSAVKLPPSLPSSPETEYV